MFKILYAFILCSHTQKTVLVHTGRPPAYLPKAGTPEYYWTTKETNRRGISDKKPVGTGSILGPRFRIKESICETVGNNQWQQSLVTSKIKPQLRMEEILRTHPDHLDTHAYTFLRTE